MKRHIKTRLSLIFNVLIILGFAGLFKAILFKIDNDKDYNNKRSLRALQGDFKPSWAKSFNEGD